MEHFSGVDWVVLVGYFVLTMSIGFYFYRKSRSSDGFMAAGRSLPGWACGLSILATYLSSISFLALPGKAYAANWNPFVFSLSLPIATWIAVKFFMPYYRRTGDVSAYAHLEKRFGPWARGYASFFYILTQLARMGVVMYLMALPLCVLLQKDLRWIIVFTGLSVTVYAFVGGVVAVIWADAMQAIVLMVGAAVCSVILLFNMPEGAGQVFEIAAAHDKFSLGVFRRLGLTEATFWVVLVYGIVINLQNFGIDQSYIQRYIASKSDREARKSVWLGGLLYVPVSAVFMFIGTQLFAYYDVHPEYKAEAKLIVAEQKILQEGISKEQMDFRLKVAERAETLDEKAIGDGVFPHFIGKVLPRGVTGLLIAAIFAAGMSTVSTSLNSSATLLVTDWYRRFVDREASEKRTMAALYAATVFWGISGTCVALLLTKTSESILDVWWTLSGILGGGMIGLFLLGMISRRANNPTAIVSVCLGVCVLAWMSLSVQGAWLPGNLRFGWHKFLIPVFGTLTILLTGILLSRFFHGGGEGSES
ncbi:MAG: sodium:solute symporter family protein [Planctomycetota bacterium]|jgi:SSS family solute:Na+ symporter